MGLGQMNQFIDIIRVVPEMDNAGFRVGEHDEILASVRAYYNNRHGRSTFYNATAEITANRAAFVKAMHQFRFRVIPDVQVTPDMVIIHNGNRYNILSAGDINSRGMYIEVLAEIVTPSKGV